MVWRHNSDFHQGFKLRGRFLEDRVRMCFFDKVQLVFTLYTAEETNETKQPPTQPTNWTKLPTSQPHQLNQQTKQSPIHTSIHPSIN